MGVRILNKVIILFGSDRLVGKLFGKLGDFGKKKLGKRYCLFSRTI